MNLELRAKKEKLKTGQHFTDLFKTGQHFTDLFKTGQHFTDLFKKYARRRRLQSSVRLLVTAVHIKTSHNILSLFIPKNLFGGNNAKDKVNNPAVTKQ